MNEQSCIVRFSATNYPALTLEKYQHLSQHLTIQNSPVLFGCRTGICGTCLVVIEGDIPPADEQEKELLEILAPCNERARLACQVVLTSDIDISLYTEEK